MNMLAPPRTKLSIEVILDLVCPWCYLGTKRLLRTLRQRPGRRVVSMLQSPSASPVFRRVCYWRSAGARADASTHRLARCFRGPGR